jgi:hypothetical protein
MNWITPYIENAAAILHYYLYAGKGFLPSLAPTVLASQSREQASLLRGIEVGDAAWNEMAKLSRRILVAATRESRARGQRQ